MNISNEEILETIEEALGLSDNVVIVHEELTRYLPDFIPPIKTFENIYQPGMDAAKLLKVLHGLNNQQSKAIQQTIKTSSNKKPAPKPKAVTSTRQFEVDEEETQAQAKTDSQQTTARITFPKQDYYTIAEAAEFFFKANDKAVEDAIYTGSLFPSYEIVTPTKASLTIEVMDKEDENYPFTTTSYIERDILFKGYVDIYGLSELDESGRAVIELYPDDLETVLSDKKILTLFCWHSTGQRAKVHLRKRCSFTADKLLLSYGQLCQYDPDILYKTSTDAGSLVQSYRAERGCVKTSCVGCKDQLCRKELATEATKQFSRCDAGVAMGLLEPTWATDRDSSDQVELQKHELDAVQAQVGRWKNYKPKTK